MQLKDSINWKKKGYCATITACTHCTTDRRPCTHTQTAIHILPPKYTIHLSVCSALFTQLLQGMKNALSVSGGEIDESKNLPQLPQAIPAFIPAYQIIATGSFFFFKYTYTLTFLEKHTMLMYACISLCFSQKSHTSCNIKIASLSLSPTTVSPLESLPCHFQT